MSLLTLDQKINSLCNSENFYNSEELQTIINKYNISFTQNSNGIFLNLSLLDKYIIDEIYLLFTREHNKQFFIDADNNLSLDNVTIENLPIKSVYKTPKNNIKNNKINVKHTKLDYLILRTLNENLNLI